MTPLPAVLFQPAAHQRFSQGVNTLVDIVRPTLGPRPRAVAVSATIRTQLPEILDDAATIARRVTALSDRDADMGAMFVRHLLWRVQQEVGDGTATTAVLFQSLFNQGVRYIAAGGNAQQLRRPLELGMAAILGELTTMTTARVGEAALTRLAEATCHDLHLAQIMGEIFTLVGADGHVVIRAGRSREHAHDYIEGAYWDGSGVLTNVHFINEVRARVELEQAALVLSDLDVMEPGDIIPLITIAQQAHLRAVVILARRIADTVLPWLLGVNREQNMHIVIVKTPGSQHNDTAAALEDLAMLTGGRPMLAAAGDALRRVTTEHVGRARRVWADRQHVGVVGGNADARRLRQHVAMLRQRHAHSDTLVERNEVHARIGRLLGGSATLWVGGLSDHAITMHKHLAERTASLLRSALREGVVPGGGTALLRCRSVLTGMANHATNDVEHHAYGMLIRALEAPFCTIVRNAGHEPQRMLSAFNNHAPGAMFDSHSGQLVDVSTVGTFDSAAVQKAAVRGAISAAALALTIDVLVHKKQPVQSVEP